MEQVQDAVRAFTLPLWNVYAFFVTYANLDGWRPDGQSANLPTVDQDGGLPEALPYTDLDRWLRSELHALVSEVTAALEGYDVPGATRPLQAFVDDLSKWYLRRSRRRFWKDAAAQDALADKQVAYRTLYEVLVTLSKVLAPTMPFLAEALYQNLVRSFDREAPISVHLTDWPQVDPQAIDLGLNAKMRLVMKLASLGHAARAQAGIKVRQPLAEAAFWLVAPEEAAVLEGMADLLADELNVKKVRVLDSAGEAVSYRLKPLPKQLGSKYQSQYPKVREAIEKLEPDEAAARLIGGEAVQIRVDDMTLDITPEEVEVHLDAHAGLAVASEVLIWLR